MVVIEKNLKSLMFVDIPEQQFAQRTANSEEQTDAFLTMLPFSQEELLLARTLQL